MTAPSPFTPAELEEAAELCEWLEYRRAQLKQESDDERAARHERTGDDY